MICMTTITMPAVGLEPNETTTAVVKPSETTRELSYGERAVGLTFNPGGNPDVDKVKKLYAEIIDLISRIEDGSNYSEFKRELKKEATMSAVTAQMAAVKVITYKY